MERLTFEQAVSEFGLVAPGTKTQVEPHELLKLLQGAIIEARENPTSKEGMLMLSYLEKAGYFGNSRLFVYVGEK